MCSVCGLEKTWLLAASQEKLQIDSYKMHKLISYLIIMSFPAASYVF